MLRTGFQNSQIRRKFSQSARTTANMKNFVRFLALLLVLITCVTMIVACDKTGNEGGNEGGDDEGLLDDQYDVNGRWKDDLPKTLNFEGEKVKVLYWQDVEKPEFEVETISGDNVMDAIYNRNTQIESRLNVDLQWYGQNGGQERVKFVKHVEAQYNTGTQMYDLIAAHIRTEGTLAVQGYLYNLATITEDNYLNLKQPWWPAQLVETVNFGGAYYFVSGDMSTNVLNQMEMIYFNKKLYNRHNIKDTDIYQLVYDDKWTLDKLIELTANCYEDIDNTPGASPNDRYGFVSMQQIIDSFYPGSNLRLVEEDDNSMLKISSDFGSAKTVKLINKLGQWAATDDVRIHNSFVEDTATREDIRQAFKTGRAYMIMNRAQAGQSYAKLDAVDIGLCPVPKYDEAQVNYYTGMGDNWSLYGIFVDFDERGDKELTLSMLSAVMECWASEGYRLTTPEIFEVNMQLKYSNGQDETNMFEYIRSGITFDLGNIFAVDLGNINELPSNAICQNASWSSSYASYKNALNARCEQIVKNFKQYQDERDDLAA